MKNIITIALILIVPILSYILISKKSADVTAVAKETTKPSIMIFTSSMCMDCQKMKAVIKSVEPQYSDKINFIAINATSNDRNVKENIKKYNVILVPTMIFLDSENNQKNKIEGYIPEEELKIELDGLIHG